jgi:putative glutamine amidotransferase
VVDAHPLRIVSGSHLEKVVAPRGGRFDEAVNSSHHQALRRIGDRLQVAAISPEDQVIEAVELISTDHFVLGVQWHPERTFAVSELSRGMFRAFIAAAEAWRAIPERITSL